MHVHNDVIPKDWTSNQPYLPERFNNTWPIDQLLSLIGHSVPEAVKAQ